MATARNLPLMTCDQFFALAEPSGNFTYELHFGELVKVGRPKKKHFSLQMRVRDILVRTLGAAQWMIEIEMPYGLAKGFDARAADVGVTRRKTWDAVPEDDYLIGSPDLVVQIKSRSNRDRKMEEDAIAHITHGASAVWLVRPERREIVVVTAGSRKQYGRSDQIKLSAPFSGAVQLGEIFTD